MTMKQATGNHTLTLAQINPDAGMHPVPTDPVVLEAALRAGERMLERYPYLVARFGERGRRFTASDSAWLATLIRYPQALVDAQVFWLGGVLSHRGIPRLLLERHLIALARELRSVSAPADSDVQRLCRAATALAAQRRARLDDRTIARVERSLARSLRTTSLNHWRGTGEIIASAVADQVNDVTADLGATVDWLIDERRFARAWISAVTEALGCARAGVRA
jgi:hypothetical protein